MIDRELIEHIRGSKNWYIYGAGIVAYNIYIAMKKTYGVSPKAFIVTTKKEKEEFIPNEWIVEWESERERLVGAKILVATPEVYHGEIVSGLEQAGVDQYILVDADLEYKIMAEYYRIGRKICLLEDFHREETCSRGKQNLKVYMAKCHKDRVLHKKYAIPDYIMPIQVGAVFTDEKIADIRDDEGCNISYKNQNYSELTATYWVWKNTDHDYKGICHYRRMLLLSEDELSVIQNGLVDAVLPLPFECPNCMEEQYKRYINRRDLEYLLVAIRDLYPEQINHISTIMKGKYIYNYNMLIAKKEVFDDYCEWNFSILKQAEKYCDVYQNRNDRYAGYLGELLFTIYFLMHKEEYEIRHVKRIWMT